MAVFVVEEVLSAEELAEISRQDAIRKAEREADPEFRRREAEKRARWRAR